MLGQCDPYSFEKQLNCCEVWKVMMTIWWWQLRRRRTEQAGSTVPVSYGFWKSRLVVRGSNPDRSKRLFSSPKLPDRLRGAPSFLFNVAGVLSREYTGLGVKSATHVHLVPRLWVELNLYSLCMPSWRRQGQPYLLRPMECVRNIVFAKISVVFLQVNVETAGRIYN
jgi:hypothetical protein